MTGRDLIDYIKNNGLQNYEVVVQFRDEGGDYDGVDDELRLEYVKEQYAGQEKRYLIL